MPLLGVLINPVKVRIQSIVSNHKTKTFSLRLAMTKMDKFTLNECNRLQLADSLFSVKSINPLTNLKK